jgi:hypothetical protein
MFTCCFTFGNAEKNQKKKNMENVNLISECIKKLNVYEQLSVFGEVDGKDLIEKFESMPASTQKSINDVCKTLNIKFKSDSTIFRVEMLLRDKQSVLLDELNEIMSPDEYMNFTKNLNLTNSSFVVLDYKNS